MMRPKNPIPSTSARRNRPPGASTRTTSRSAVPCSSQWWKDIVVVATALPPPGGGRGGGRARLGPDARLGREAGAPHRDHPLGRIDPDQPRPGQAGEERLEQAARPAAEVDDAAREHPAGADRLDK